MKKSIQLILAVVSIAFLFSACNKVDEDYYFPKVKLASIKSDDYTATFKYDKKKLSQILMDDETITVIYNDNKQISELDCSVDNEKVLMTYNDDKKITRCDYYKGANLLYYQEFVRSGDHIASVRTYGSSDDWKKISQGKLFRMCFNTTLIDKVIKNAPKADLTLTTEEFWTYSGTNVSLITSSVTYAGVTATMKTAYTYDEKHNPFYGLPYYIGQTMAYSTNNGTSMISSFVLGNTTTTTDTQYFTYTYNDDDYPTVLTTSATQGGSTDNIMTFSYE